ncbi:MAG: hypothetical protein IKY83_05585 [Proteobacteria bacterium]|nr:hypothetical protein [Pseudomonadota bacterium]
MQRCMNCHGLENTYKRKLEYEDMASERRPSGFGNHREGSPRFGRGDVRRKREGHGSGSYAHAPEDRVMYDAVCAECGQAFQVPFEPDADRSVYCRACFQQKRDEMPRREPRESREPRETFEIVCSHCGKKDVAPFRPYPDSVVLCRDCKKDPNVTRSKDRVYHRIICSSCGCETEVPFKPDPGSRVLCHDCHNAEREEKKRKRAQFEKDHPAGNGMEVRIEIRCEQCGAIDRLPFAPKTHGKILCRQCAENLFGEDWAKRNKVGAQEYPFTCARCAAQGFVPFRPKEGQTLLCNHCLEEQAVLGHKGIGKRHDGGICIRRSDNKAGESAGSAGKEDGQKS